MAAVAAWCTAFFFLLYGLAAFVPTLNTDTFKKTISALALLVGVLQVLALVT
jgi:hypothetical protein